MLIYQVQPKFIRRFVELRYRNRYVDISFFYQQISTSLLHLDTKLKPPLTNTSVFLSRLA